MDAGDAETSSIQLASAGRGWGCSPRCQKRGQGLKVLGAGAGAGVRSGSHPIAPLSKKAERGQWGWESPWGDQRDILSFLQEGEACPFWKLSRRAKDRPVSSPRQRLMETWD